MPGIDVDVLKEARVVCVWEEAVGLSSLGKVVDAPGVVCEAGTRRMVRGGEGGHVRVALLVEGGVLSVLSVFYLALLWLCFGGGDGPVL